MAEAERREQITAGIVERTGITEAMIERLVHGFYAKVRSAPMIGRCSRPGSPIGSRISPRCARSGPRWR